MIGSIDELADELRRTVCGSFLPWRDGVDPLRNAVSTILRKCEQDGVEPYGTLQVYPALPFEPVWHFRIESELPPLPPARTVTYKRGRPEGDSPICETVLLDNCEYICPCGSAFTSSSWSDQPTEEWFHAHYSHSNGYCEVHNDPASWLKVSTTVPEDYTREIT